MEDHTWSLLIGLVVAKGCRTNGINSERSLCPYTRLPEYVKVMLYEQFESE